MMNQGKWQKLFNLYNEDLSDKYEQVIENYEDEDQMRSPDFYEQLRNHVLNDMQAWYMKPNEGLDCDTPAQIIDSISSVDEAIDVIKLAASACDDAIPEYLLVRLGSFGTGAIESLAKAALLPSWEAGIDTEDTPNDDLLFSSAALKILGEWQAIGMLDDIMAKFVRTGIPHEFIADAFQRYITGIGAESIPYLLKALNDACLNGDDFTGTYEYLIIALTTVSQESREDKVFTCLRSCFRAMEHKAIGAICLGDYGDARGISVLKGYLDRNEGRFDRQEFYEILSSIKRLGGDISDVKDPFKDFSGKK